MASYNPHQLHDRATRGEGLTADEQTALAQWYAAQDQAESRSLRAAAASSPLADLRSQLDAAVRQLAVVSQRIEETMLINETIRRDILQLQAQLSGRVLDQAA